MPNPIISKRFFDKVTFSYSNIDLKIYLDYFSTLQSPKIRVYLRKYLNAAHKRCKMIDNHLWFIAWYSLYFI